jgi:hypothetical protein
MFKPTDDFSPSLPFNSYPAAAAPFGTLHALSLSIYISTRKNIMQEKWGTSNVTLQYFFVTPSLPD